MTKVNAAMRSYAMRSSVFGLYAEKDKEPMRTPGISPIAREAMAYVLAGGRGSRLMELTAWRAKPAVYFGGKSRIVDFALSNAFNSGIRHIAVATQYKAHSLIRHLHRAWNIMRPHPQRELRYSSRERARLGGGLVSGHCGRGLSEPRHYRRLRPEIPRGAGGRSRLQNGLRVDAPTASGAESRRYGWLHRGPTC